MLPKCSQFSLGRSTWTSSLGLEGRGSAQREPESDPVMSRDRPFRAFPWALQNTLASLASSGERCRFQRCRAVGQGRVPRATEPSQTCMVVVSSFFRPHFTKEELAEAEAEAEEEYIPWWCAQPILAYVS